MFQPASSPESVGLPSAAVRRFLERIDRNRICLHGFLLVRHNHVASEGYWAPFTPDRLHRMYSVSKSFVSLAIGSLIGEGRLRLEDRVASFFPDKVPPDLHPWLAEATVRDLLMMATPHSENAYTRHDPDWAWCFFNKQPSHPAGTIFAYDTAATVVLNTIVERISRVPYLEYLRPRLLDPIGFSRDAWCVQTPEGSSWGGSGVQCTLRDLAKVALVCQNGGRWDDQQLLPADYVREATGCQIDNSIGGNAGYGYQIWREKENGFSFRGMGSQLAICFPEQDFIFTCIADTQGAGSTGQGIYDAMREELLAHLSPAALPEEPEDLAQLRQKVASLEVLPQSGDSRSAWTDRVDGRWYALDDNPMGITRTRLSFSSDSVLWSYTNAQGDKTLRLGLGRCLAGVFPQLGYFGKQIGVPISRGYDCLASAAWVEPHKLNLLVYITDDYFGTLKVSMAYQGDQIAGYMTKVAEWFLDEYQGFAGGRLV
ncbi:MAG: serine hydrolase [Clostridiaceae bacterium]|nr:serine hydrolase [Clostridiaceae bacterium]